MWLDSLPDEPTGKPKNTIVGSQSLLQQIFLTQESNLGFLYCRQILYQLSYQGSLISESHSVMSDCLQPRGLYSPWPEYWSGFSLLFLQGIFPTQGLNPGLPHCRWLLYQLSHKGSSRKLEWVAYLFFPIQESNQGLLHCRQILYQLSYQGSPPRTQAFRNRENINF